MHGVISGPWQNDHWGVAATLTEGQAYFFERVHKEIARLTSWSRNNAFILHLILQSP